MKKLAHEEAIGLSGPEFDFPIERGKVREFAKSLYAFLPEYLEAKPPLMFPTQPVVAGYSWGYMLEDPKDTPIAQVDIDGMLSLDAEQEFIYPEGPPCAGTELVARTWVDDIWEKHGRKGGKLTFYRTRSDYRDADGRLVGTNYATSVVPDGVPDTPMPAMKKSDVAYLRHDDKRDQFAAIRRASWDELVAGRTPGPVAMPPLTLTEVVRYQIVSGSDGAGHHDTAAARAEGFPDWFSVGMFHAGLLATYAVSWLGPANVRRLKFRFLDVLWPGERLTYGGEVAKTYAEGGERKVDIELACARSDGQSVVRGWATFVGP